MMKWATYLELCLVATLLTPAWLSGQEGPIQASEEAAIRKLGTEYVDAFNSHDAKLLASYWSPEAVYVNRVTGEQVVGRAAIQQQFEALFKPENKLQLSVEVESIQFISPNVAAEHGVASFVTPEADPEQVAYTAVYVRQGGRWLLDRVTDKESLPNQSSYEQLKPLQWMIGRWVDEDENASIVTDCKWTKNNTFMVRSFTVAIEDRIDLSGMQIIGWDAGSKQIRSWTFDSDGGVAQGVWSKSKDGWYVHKKGTTASGETTTAIHHVKPIDDDTFAFQSTQRTVAGQLLPNIDEVLVVRQ
jgi:uncharacterized protein (TIGR02246 family)